LQAQFYFLNVYMKYDVFMLRWPHTIEILISNQPRMQKFSQLFKNTGGVDLLLPRSWVGYTLRSIFMLHLETCLLWQLMLTVLCQLVMFLTVFPLDVQNAIQLLSRVFCYPFLVCLLGFGWEMCRLSKLGNPISDGIVFVFHLA